MLPCCTVNVCGGKFNSKEGEGHSNCAWFLNVFGMFELEPWNEKPFTSLVFVTPIVPKSLFSETGGEIYSLTSQGCCGNSSVYTFAKQGRHIFVGSRNGPSPEAEELSK